MLRALFTLITLIGILRSPPPRWSAAPARRRPAIARAVVLIVGSRGNFCSGVALARDLVLTAAHCVLPGADYKIVEYDSARQPQLRDVASVTAHPKFDIKTHAGASRDRRRGAAEARRAARIRDAGRARPAPASRSRRAIPSPSRAPASRRAATASRAEPCARQISSRPGGPEPCRSAFMTPQPRARKPASAPAPATAARPVFRHRERRARGHRRGELVDRARERGRLRRPHRRDAAHPLSRLDHTVRKNTWEPNLILRLRA